MKDKQCCCGCNSLKEQFAELGPVMEKYAKTPRQLRADRLPEKPRKTFS